MLLPDSPLPVPCLVRFACPSIEARGRRAFVSRRSYLFRLACARHPVNEALSLDVLRALWRVASCKARAISTT